MHDEPLLRATGISKTYGATNALVDIDIAVGAGEVVALVGENGAGKSTLVRILSGGELPDNGTVAIEGKELALGQPRIARAAGIAVIHQELSYVGTMTVAENLFLGAYPKRSIGLLDRKKLIADAREAMAPIDASIDVRERLDHLSVGARQLVEIARAIATKPRILLLDEPTAALSTSETERLFAVIERLKASLIGMIYISHRLRELEVVADRIVVLRDGHRVGDHPSTVSHDVLVHDIIGRTLERARSHHLDGDSSDRSHEVVLFELAGLSTAVLRELSLKVHEGEVVGLYGLPGSGIEDVAYAIVGERAASGTVAIGGQIFADKRNPIALRRAGFALVPADRRDEGLFADLAVGFNIAIGPLGESSGAKRARAKAEAKIAREQIDLMEIRPGNPDLIVGSMSGGNQQKTIFARWFATAPKVMVLDQPTRGVDIGAKAQIYDLVHRAVSKGTAVLVISPEPDELLAVCTHIGVIHHGELSNLVEASDLDEDHLVLAALSGGTL